MSNLEEKTNHLFDRVELLVSEVTALQTLKDEVDALQVVVMKESKPWYKQVPTLVAVLALLFSFSTTYVSYKKAEAEDVRSLRTELRGLLQRLVSMPKEHLEVQQKYTNEPAKFALISGFLGSENTFIVQQAAAIAKRLPEHAVFPSEYSALAFALQNTNDNESALYFFKRAIETATDFNTEINALRGYANTSFLVGRLDEGRKTYKEALEIGVKHNNQTVDTLKVSDGLTYLSQAFSEAQLGSIEAAKQSLDKAESIANSSIPARETIGPQVIHMRRQLDLDQTITTPPTRNR